MKRLAGWAAALTLVKRIVVWAGALTLFCTSGSVQAAGTYELTSWGAWNSYAATPGDSTGAVPNGGIATVTAGGAFTATGVQFSFINANSTFNYSGSAEQYRVTCYFY